MLSFGFFVILFMWLLAVGLPSTVVAFRAYHAGAWQRVLLFASCGLLFLFAWAGYTDPEFPGVEAALGYVMLMWGVLLYLGALVVFIVKACTWGVRAFRREA